jgi:uncharacterized membrane protein
MRLPLLILHISAGTLAVLAGFTAIFVRKGSRQHEVVGNVFVVSMLVLAVSAVYLAFLKHQMNNVFGGLLTAYLVTTAWMTARRRDGRTGIFDWIALLIGLAVGVAIVTYGIHVAASPTAPADGIPAGMYFVMGSMALLAAAGDVRMLARGGVSGAQRIVRHLWRMSFALFFATGSFFLGQQQVFPAFIRNANVLFIPALLPLVLMIFWVVRVGFARKYRAALIQSFATQAKAVPAPSIESIR